MKYPMHALVDRERRERGAPRRLVLEHGWNATAYQILNPGIAHWFAREGDAVIGYVTPQRRARSRRRSRVRARSACAMSSPSSRAARAQQATACATSAPVSDSNRAARARARAAPSDSARSRAGIRADGRESWRAAHRCARSSIARATRASPSRAWSAERAHNSPELAATARGVARGTRAAAAPLSHRDGHHRPHARPPHSRRAARRARGRVSRGVARPRAPGMAHRADRPRTLGAERHVGAAR